MVDLLSSSLIDITRNDGEGMIGDVNFVFNVTRVEVVLQLVVNNQIVNDHTSCDDCFHRLSITEATWCGKDVQFFHSQCMQSIDPMQPGNPAWHPSSNKRSMSVAVG